MLIANKMMTAIAYLAIYILSMGVKKFEEILDFIPRPSKLKKETNKQRDEYN